MTKLDTRFRILALAIMDLSDQELSIALEEFERTMVGVYILQIKSNCVQDYWSRSFIQQQQQLYLISRWNYGN